MLRHLRDAPCPPVTLLLLGMALLLASPRAASALSSGPQPGTTGAPAIGSDAAEQLCTSCHNTSPPNPDTQGRLSIDGVPEKYQPGQTYHLTLTLAHDDKNVLRWGFQLTAVSTKDGAGAGSLVATDVSKTQVIQAMTGTRNYIEHNYGGTCIGTSGSCSWSFDWVAPMSDVGTIGFFAAGNAANADGSNQGDRIYSKSPAPLASSEAGH